MNIEEETKESTQTNGAGEQTDMFSMEGMMQMANNMGQNIQETATSFT